MSRSAFHLAPGGFSGISIPDAKSANGESTVELVKDHEHDSFYFRSLEKKGIYLNEPQIAAVRHLQGPALVLAGAGSGKTRVLTSRVGYLLTIHDAIPSRVLVMTFTKKAAEEMKERIASLPGLTRKYISELTTGTFHSIFLHILRKKGYEQKILSNDRQKEIAIKVILRKRDLQDSYEPEILLALLSSYKCNMISVKDLPSHTPLEREIKEIFTEFEEWKGENNYLDFDDILFESYELLVRDKTLLNLLQDRFQYILCDEWQDTNPLQYELVKMLAAPQNNLFVVGDDDQTIYSFNGADSNIILNFDKEYSNTEIFTLDINYRSEASIVGLANSIIVENQVRRPKTLKAAIQTTHRPKFLRPKNTDDEADMIVQNIMNEVNNKERVFKDYVILYRTVSSSRAMFDRLVMKDIPFITYAGADTFYESIIVKPVIDHLRLAIKPLGMETLSGILPTLYLSREKAIEHVSVEHVKNRQAELITHLLKLPDLKEFTRKNIIERIDMMRNLVKMPAQQAVKEVRKVYDKYMDANERKIISLHKEMIKETLAEVESAAKPFQSVYEFVSFVEKIIEKNKAMEELRKNPDIDAVHLMSIHKSKGLEYPIVYVIGASETILPHSSALEADSCEDMVLKQGRDKKIEAAIEEECRLAYVASTRAQQELYISSPSEYRNKDVEVSRFFIQPFVKQMEAKQQLPAAAVRLTQSMPDRGAIWDCTNCPAWVRIRPGEGDMDIRNCPLCNYPMSKTLK